MVNRVDNRQIDPWRIPPLDACPETTRQVYRYLWGPHGTTLDIRRLELDLLVFLYKGTFNNNETAKIAAKFLTERMIESVLPDRPVPGEGRGCMLFVSKTLGEAIIDLCVRYGYPINEEPVLHARARARAEVCGHAYQSGEDDMVQEYGGESDVEIEDDSEEDRYNQYFHELQHSSQPRPTGSQQQETRSREASAAPSEPAPEANSQVSSEPRIMCFRRSAIAPRNTNSASHTLTTHRDVFSNSSASSASTTRGDIFNTDFASLASTSPAPAPATRKDIFRTPLTPIIEQRKAEELERSEYVRRRQEARELMKAHETQTREMKYASIQSGSDEEPEYLFSFRRGPQAAKAMLAPKRKEIRGIVKNGGEVYDEMSTGLVDADLLRQSVRCECHNHRKSLDH